MITARHRLSTVSFLRRCLTGLALGLLLVSSALAQVASDVRVIAKPGELSPDDVGVSLLHDYGAYALYAIAGDQLEAVQAGMPEPIRTATELDIIQLDRLRLNTKTFRLDDVPAPLRIQEPQGAALQLIQFAGPIKDE